MKSSILLIMFVFAMMTCCLDMCDGADEEAKATVKELGDIVNNQTEILQNFLNRKEAAIKKKLEENVLNLMKTLDTIVDSFKTEIENYAKDARPKKVKNECRKKATTELKKMAFNAKKEFKEFTEFVNVNVIYVLDRETFKYAKLLIEQCTGFVSEPDPSGNFLALIELKYEIFEQLVTADTSIITSTASIARTSSNNRAKQIEDDLKEDSNKIQADLKKCIDTK